ncbi:MAG TPA: site-2 protease family protein [Pirellulaceae bacterium]|nr:site-2 protease family protein [Pirellulaceae bacterium]
MRSHTSWSIGLGRWGGHHVRLHMFFLLFAVCTFFFAWQASQEPASHDLVWIAAGSLCILLTSVLLHEWGHYFAAIRTGGDGDEIVIGPLGGLTSMRPPPDPFAECLMHLAGPLVNLTICLVCGAALQFLSPGSVMGLLDPLAPRDLVEQAGLIGTLKLTFWINWVVMLANLLPAFPFDGGRALRAALTGLWPDASPRRAALFVATLAKFAALALLVFAWLQGYYFGTAEKTTAQIPIWFSLALLSIFLYFSAKHEEDRVEEVESEDDLFGYDFSQGYMSLEQSSKPRPPHDGPFKRWLERKRREKLRRQSEVEQEEERRVDEILERLHDKGMDQLSHEEQLLLKRVSHRYRQRNSQ